MWTELLFHLGIILALLAVLYYVETRVKAVETCVNPGVPMQQINTVIHGIIERQNDLAMRYNKIDEYLTEFNKWALVDDEAGTGASAGSTGDSVDVCCSGSNIKTGLDSPKTITVDMPFLVEVSDDGSSYDGSDDGSDIGRDDHSCNESSCVSDTTTDSGDDGESDVSSITYDAGAEVDLDINMEDIYDILTEPVKVEEDTTKHIDVILDDAAAAAVEAPQVTPEIVTLDDDKAASVVETVVTEVVTGGAGAGAVSATGATDSSDLSKKSVKELRHLAKEHGGIKGNISQMTKHELIVALTGTGATTINI